QRAGGRVLVRGGLSLALFFLYRWLFTSFFSLPFRLRLRQGSKRQVLERSFSYDQQPICSQLTCHRPEQHFTQRGCLLPVLRFSLSDPHMMLLGRFAWFGLARPQEFIDVAGRYLYLGSFRKFIACDCRPTYYPEVAAL